DNERWHVALVGTAGNVPPIDEQDLPDPGMYEALRIAQPLTPIRGFAISQNHWRHFELMHRWPTGFIVTGNAVCAFNPMPKATSDSDFSEASTASGLGRSPLRA